MTKLDWAAWAENKAQYFWSYIKNFLICVGRPQIEAALELKPQSISPQKN